MNPKPRLYADFQKLDEAGRLILSCSGTHRDIEEQKLTLSEGLEVLFYSDDCDDEGNDDELRVDGVVQYDAATASWVGVYDSAKFRHASDD